MTKSNVTQSVTLNMAIAASMAAAGMSIIVAV